MLAPDHVGRCIMAVHPDRRRAETANCERREGFGHGRATPLSRFRDSLPSRHGRAAHERASGFIAPESMSIWTRWVGCQAREVS